MMPIVGLFLAILGFSNVNLRFLAHFHELQRKTSLRMKQKMQKTEMSNFPMYFLANSFVNQISSRKQKLLRIKLF